MNEALKNEIKNMDDLRTQEWITARLSKPGSQGNMIFSPNMDDLIKRLVESDKRKSQGLCEAGIDPLIEEFGPEHGGCTRGLGNVGFRKGIEGYVQKKKRKREVDESLLTHKAEESAKCYLFSPYTKDKTLIAWGAVNPIRDAFGPSGDESVTLLGQAIGSFFQWPQCRISCMKEITPTSKSKDQQMKTTMPTSVLALEIDLVAENTTSAPILQQKDALKNAQKAI
nr:hypothetical protein [Tanacetum cinerariifolium]